MLQTKSLLDCNQISIYMINRALHIRSIKVRALGGSKVIYIPQNYCQDYAINKGDNLQMGIGIDGDNRVAQDVTVKQFSNKSGNKGIYITIPSHIHNSLSLDKGDEVGLSLRPESDSITSERKLREQGMGWPEGVKNTSSSGDTRFLEPRQRPTMT